MSEEKKLPTIAELVKGDITIPGKLENDLNILLNQQPPSNWLKVNQYAGNSQYLPIDKVEYLLTKIFIDWFLVSKSVQMIGNSIATIGTLYYRPVFDYLKDEIFKCKNETEKIELQKIYYTRKKEDWYNKHDGQGAAQIQVEAGEKPSDFDKIKAYGVAIAVGKSKSVAISDAADNIGRIFGKDLNRKDLINYNTLSDDERFGKIMS